MTTRVARTLAWLPLLAFVACGAVLLGVGISDVRHAHDIATGGVRADAQVIANDGYGKFAVEVSYPTAGGISNGTLNVPHEAGRYAIGSRLRVEYARGSPSVVTLAGRASATDGWIKTGIGSAMLAVVVGLGLRAGLRRRAGLTAGRS